MKKQHSMDLTTGSLVKKLLIFAFPILVSNVLQQFYNTADMIVVGRFVGDDALAAVGATGELSVLIINLFFGLSVGANIICSNLFGARNKEGLSKAMHNAITVAVISGLCMGVIGFFLARTALGWTGCPGDIIGSATLYMQIYFCGSPASMLYNFGSAILRAHGDTKRPMLILVISGLVNVGLNLFLVIVCHMGISGVAIATVASQIVSAVMVLWILFAPKEGYCLQVKLLKIHRDELIKLIRIGVPCGINGVVFNFSNVILQTSVNSLGKIAMAGVTASSRITNMVYAILSSTYSACVSFAGQCYGAKNYKRISQLWGKSIALSAGFIAVIAVALTVFSDTALSLFTSNPEVIGAARPMLILFAWSYAFYTIPECTVGCLRGMGESIIPTAMNIFCICGPRLVWNYVFFPMRPSIGWLYVCFPISYVVCAIAQVGYFLYRRKHLHVKSLA